MECKSVWSWIKNDESSAEFLCRYIGGRVSG